MMELSYWWVNHTTTFKAESEGGYIWSPKTKRNGTANKSYSNLTLAQPGDLVFSYAQTCIRAVGIVTAAHVTKAKPKYLAPGAESWADTGWYVKIDWLALAHPVAPRDHLGALRPLLPQRHSPIQDNGNGNQGIYLAAISSDFAEELLRILEARNRGLISGLTESVAVVIDRSVDRRNHTTPTGGTDRMQISLARTGHGLFRQRVADIESRCRVTGVSQLSLLTASHIKPWRLSTDDERLDGFNGLLLAPHVDRLFDRGFVTFLPDGSLRAASAEIRNVMSAWGLDHHVKITRLHKQQEAYMAFHRENIFDKPWLPSLQRLVEVAER